MNKKLKLVLMLLAAALILFAVIFMAAVLFSGGQGGSSSAVYREKTVEAGDVFDPSVFLKDKSLTVQVSEDSKYDTHKVGYYPITLLLSNGKTEKVTLRVCDTKPPKAIFCPPMLVKKGSSAFVTERILPESFIVDETKVTVTFLNDTLDTSELGKKTVSLQLKDEGNNVSLVEINLFVVEELNLPEFYEIGVETPDLRTILPDTVASFDSEQDLAPRVPGMVTAYLKMQGDPYVIRYEMRDTVAPVAFPSTEIPIFHVGDSLPENPAALLTGIKDETELSFRYAEKYSLNKSEHLEVRIIVTDLGMNSIVVTVPVPVFDEGENDDTVPPTIYGVRNMETQVGNAPDYLKGITVYDGNDGEIPTENIRIDTSSVKLYRESTGEGYPVIYSVRDSAGNLAQVTVYLKVTRPQVSDEEMEELFDRVWEQLNISSTDARVTKLSRVYDFVSTYRLKDNESNIADPKEYKKEAYWGLRLKSGDYRTYCAITAVLLDKLSIDYKQVERYSTGSRPHAWLLVDYGYGWMYMDCTPIKGYVWTNDGRLLEANTPEAKVATSKRQEAMTDADIKQLTELFNAVIPGLNYYRANESAGTLPPTATKDSNGRYVSAKYTVNYRAGEGGTIEGSTVQTVTHGGYASTVTAVPKPGQKFDSWSDGVKTATRTDRVTDSFTVYANFSYDPSTLSNYTVNYIASDFGRISGSTTQTVRYGNTTVEVTAVADDGYYFLKWSDGVTTPNRSDAVKGDASYTAIFAKKVVYTYLAQEGGRIDGMTVQILIPNVGGDNVVAVPEVGYRFVGWSDGLSSAVRSEATDHDVTVTALFEKNTSAMITVTYSAGIGGHIEGATLQTQYCWSTGETVIAVADEGYEFVGWNDGKTASERTDVLIENITYVAEFKKIVTMTYAATQGGKVLGEVTQVLLSGSKGTEVTAVASEGYRFVSWSDGSVEESREDIAPASDWFITAIFEKIEP